MSDIERGLVAYYAHRVLERGDMPLRATRYILFWLNERAGSLSLPLPKSLAKIVGNIYSGAFEATEMERVYRSHREQVLATLSAAAEEIKAPEPLKTNIERLVGALELPPA